jgi:hypothetical protein
MLRMLFAFACIYCGSVHIQGAGVPLPDPIFIQGEVLQNSLQTILYALYVCQTIRPVSVRACGFRVSYIPAMPNGSPNPAPGDVQSYVLYVLGCTHTHKHPVSQPEEPCLWIKW